MNNDRGENRGWGEEGRVRILFSPSPSASLFLPAGEAPDVFAAWLPTEIAISQDPSAEVNSIRIFSPPTFITFTFKPSDLARTRTRVNFQRRNSVRFESVTARFGLAEMGYKCNAR